MTADRIDDAGVAHAAPASSSARPGADVVPQGARRELERIRRRWSELPPERLGPVVPLVREVLADLAARTAPGTPVPDLGDAVLAEQLTVLTWDAYAEGDGDGVEVTLTQVRRSLP